MKKAISTENTLLKTVLQGRLDFFRSSALYSPLVDAHFEEKTLHALYSTGLDYAPCNGVIENDINRLPTEEQINSVISFFSQKKLPFIWWTSAKKLESKGFQFGGILTGIALDISNDTLPKPVTSADLKIKKISSYADLKTFTSLAADSFAMNGKAKEQWLKLNTFLMEHHEQTHFLALLGEVPVGTVTLSTSHSSAGIWNLATTPEHRKLGIGAALVHAAILEAKSLQYKAVMAILMPKGMAWGLFKKLNFQAQIEFPFFVHGISTEALEK